MYVVYSYIVICAPLTLIILLHKGWLAKSKEAEHTSEGIIAIAQLFMYMCITQRLADNK